MLGAPYAGHPKGRLLRVGEDEMLSTRKPSCALRQEVATAGAVRRPGVEGAIRTCSYN